MKIYQIKYQAYGIQKYNYTDDFIHYYPTYMDVVRKTNLLNLESKFYDAMQEVQRKKTFD